jgi:hypothetical protein
MSPKETTGCGQTHIGGIIPDGQGYTKRVHVPIRRVPQLAERREAAEKAERRVGAEHRAAPVRGHDEAVRLNSAAERERCLRHDRLRRPRGAVLKRESEVGERFWGGAGRKVICTAPNHKATKLIGEEDCADTLRGIYEILGSVGNSHIDSKGGIK